MLAYLATWLLGYLATWLLGYLDTWMLAYLHTCFCLPWSTLICLGLIGLFQITIGLNAQKLCISGGMGLGRKSLYALILRARLCGANKSVNRI